MVKGLKKLTDYLINRPVIISALTVAFLIYSGAIKVKNTSTFYSLTGFSEITSLTGYINSNPAKTQSNRFYKADFKIQNYEALNGTFSGSGCVQILIPSQIAESFYPGKLYSINSSQGILAETGIKLKLKGAFLENQDQDLNAFFKVDDIYSFGYENTLKGKFMRLRSLSRIQFKRMMFSLKEAGGLLMALLSGSREYTESRISEGYKKAGLSHILALSGMHLSLFGGIALLFGRTFITKKIGKLLQIGAILFFVWFAGVSPSLFRALLTSIILFINSSIKMPVMDSLTALCVTFLIHSGIYPEHLFSPAFMLSYGALSGILIIGENLKKIFPKVISSKLISDLCASAGAQIFTFPVCLKLFGMIMPAGIISTIFVSPLIICFLYTGLAGMIICLFLPFLTPAFCVIINLLYNFTNRIVLFFAEFPAISI